VEKWLANLLRGKKTAKITHAACGPETKWEIPIKINFPDTL
jgi:hypothetical protein